MLRVLAALLLAVPASLYAQSSPLTVQPSTGRVGVGKTDPQYPLDVTGTVNAGGFRGDGSQLTNLPVSGADVQVFTTPGTHTWTKPVGAQMLYVIVVGGGGGGGSGRRGGNSSKRDGGHGGGSGGWSSGWQAASLLPASVAVTVGAGGAGGASRTTDSTNGNNGAPGGG